MYVGNFFNQTPSSDCGYNDLVTTINPSTCIETYEIQGLWSDWRNCPGWTTRASSSQTVFKNYVYIAWLDTINSTSRFQKRAAEFTFVQTRDVQVDSEAPVQTLNSTLKIDSVIYTPGPSRSITIEYSAKFPCPFVPNLSTVNASLITGTNPTIQHCVNTDGYKEVQGDIVFTPRLPPASMAASASGDGWSVSIYVGPTHNLYLNCYHHTAPITLDCHLGDGSTCPGFPLVSSATYRTGVVSDVIVDQKTGLAYVWGLHTTRFASGVQCFNLRTATDCGFYTLTPNGELSTTSLGTITNAGPYGRILLEDGRLLAYNGVLNQGNYGTSVNRILCFNVTSKTPCGNITFLASGITAIGEWASHMELIGGKIYVQVYTSRVYCLDPDDFTPCVGWPVLQTLAQGGGGPFAHYSTADVLNGICIRGIGTANTIPYCFHLNGTAKGYLTNAANWPIQDTTYGEYGYGTNAGSRFFGASGTRAICYDFLTASACQNWTPTFNGDALTYTITVDPENERCLYMCSDSGRITVFDGMNAGSGCLLPKGSANGSLNMVVDAGGPGKWRWFEWESPAWDTGYIGAANVTFYDGQGHWLLGPVALNRYVSTVDLSSLDSITIAASIDLQDVSSRASPIAATISYSVATVKCGTGLVNQTVGMCNATGDVWNNVNGTLVLPLGDECWGDGSYDFTFVDTRATPPIVVQIQGIVEDGFDLCAADTLNASLSATIETQTGVVGITDIALFTGNVTSFGLPLAWLTMRQATIFNKRPLHVASGSYPKDIFTVKGRAGKTIFANTTKWQASWGTENSWEVTGWLSKQQTVQAQVPIPYSVSVVPFGANSLSSGYVIPSDYGESDLSFALRVEWRGYFVLSDMNIARRNIQWLVKRDVSSLMENDVVVEDTVVLQAKRTVVGTTLTANVTSTGAIVGIAVGGVLLVVAIASIGVFVVRKRRRVKSRSTLVYYN
jgi:hypothetical protein